jgi:Uma2 family endonuclease
MPTVPAIGDAPEHIVLAGISWSYYERTLEELGNRAVRVAFLDGVMELMSPLPKHEGIKKAIGSMVAVLAMERPIPVKSYGSTTFRREDKSAGSEPDECFYFGEIDSVKNMERLDPALHRAPDLWIEVDLFSPSVAREPIYSRLGVPEAWRYDTGRLVIRLLSDDGSYRDSATSKAFPFLPIDGFSEFVSRMIVEDESLVLREFARWVRSLK